MVAPSATASSKSALMPIDSSRKPELAASLATSPKAPADFARRGRSGAHRHQASHVKAGADGLLDQGGTSAGLHPWRRRVTGVSSPGPAPSATGRRRARATACSSLSRPCQSRTCGAKRASLLRWAGPRKCHRGRAGPSSAWPAAPGRSSRRCPPVRPPRRRRRVGAEALGHRHDRHRPGRAAGQPDPVAGTAPSRARPPTRPARSRWSGHRADGPATPRSPGALVPPRPPRPVSPRAAGARCRRSPRAWPRLARRADGHGRRQIQRRAAVGGRPTVRPGRTGDDAGQIVLGERVAAWGRMHGPRTASTVVAPSRRMASTAASTTPASRPRHPACTHADHPFGARQRHRRAVGGEHRQAAPASAVTAASAVLARSPPPGLSTTTTPAPWTWLQPGPRQVDDSARRRRSTWRAGGRRQVTVGPPGATNLGPAGQLPMSAGWRRARLPSLLEEGGDVELVLVPEAEARRRHLRVGVEEADSPAGRTGEPLVARRRFVAIRHSGRNRRRSP